jgi:hypothetical protein
METVFNIANDIYTNSKADLGFLINLFNNGSDDEKFEFVYSIASQYVDYRKQFFEVKGDSNDPSTSPDFKMYRDSLYDMFDNAATYAKYGSEVALGQIVNGIDKLINPKVGQTYPLDWHNVTLLQSIVSEGVFGRNQ